MKFVGVVGWEKAEDVLCCSFLLFALRKNSFNVAITFILTFYIQQQKTENKG